MGQNILEMTKQDIDAQLENARNFESRWFLDTNVQEIAKIDGVLSKEHSQSLFQLYKELIRQSSTEPMLKKAFIYFSGSDKIVSTDGNMNLDMYYKLYLEHEDMSCEDLRTLLSEHHQYDTILFPDKNGSPYPVMLLSLKDSRGKADSATIAYLFDASLLQKRLYSAGGEESNVEIMILTEDRALIRSKNASLPMEGQDLTALHQAKEYESIPLKSNLWAASSPSSQTNWTYLMATESGAFAQDIGQVRAFFILGLFLSICTGFGLSWYLAGKNYNPFRKLTNMIKEQTQTAPDLGPNSDELQWLSSQVEHILQKNINTQKLLDKNKKHMRKFCLWQLLTADCAPEQLERCDIRFPYSCYLTVILLPKPTLPNAPTDEQTSGLRRFIIHNIFSELAEERYRVECFEFGDRVIAIFNLPEQESSAAEEIRELIEQLKEMIYSPFHFDICGLIGAIHPGQSGIRTSYREAIDLFEYLAPLDENIISVTDICGIEPRYDFLDDTEEKLVRAVSVGNCEAAQDFIRQVFDHRLAGKVSLNMYRSLIYEMIGSLLKGASLGGCTDAASTVSLPNENVIKRSMKETKKQLLSAAEELCRKIEALRQETNDNCNFSRDIEAFVDEHFSDPDLNISIASQHFDRSPSYLSNIYKKQTGRSLLEYINLKRITYAEALLMNGASVVDAAEQSGFRDSGGFIRTFKRYRGITPGQMKNIQK